MGPGADWFDDAPLYKARKGDIQLFHRLRARVMGLTRGEKQNVPFSSPAREHGDERQRRKLWNSGPVSDVSEAPASNGVKIGQLASPLADDRS